MLKERVKEIYGCSLGNPQAKSEKWGQDSAVQGPLGGGVNEMANGSEMNCMASF